MSSNNTLKFKANSSNSMKNTGESVIYRATLDSDGILRLYSHHFEITGKSNVTIEWSALQNQCEVKVFCGFNSFCSTINSSTKADCYCFPGFDFANPNMEFLGCDRKFSDEEGCNRKKPGEFYKIANIEITKLGGSPYAELSVTKEDCCKSCLHDCYGGASFFQTELAIN